MRGNDYESFGPPQEPVAAAIAYGLHNTTEERTVVVYDMARTTRNVTTLVAP